MDERKIYFLSTGRSGSTFFYKFFKKYYPELNITHQTPGSRLINILSNIPAVSNRPKLLCKISSYIKGEFPPSSTVDPLLSLAILYYFQINENELSKNIRIIHLVRDPKSFVTSFMNWKSSSVSKMILHHLIPFWQPSPRFEKELPLNERLKFDKVKQFIYVWYYKNNLIYNTFSSGNNYMRVRLEDITKSQNQQNNLNQLLEFLELPKRKINQKEFMKEKVNQSVNKKFTKYDEWPEKYKEYLSDTCGTLMQNLGYKL